MNKFIYKNWFEYDEKTRLVKLNKYPLEELKIEDTLEKTMMKQATMLNGNLGNLDILVSGGIDSQTTAYACKKANLPVNYVFYKIWYEDEYNKSEEFFALEFAKSMGIDLRIDEYRFNYKSLTDLILETDYYNTECGVGGLLHLHCMREHMKKYPDRNLITSYGLLVYTREKNICRGGFPCLYRGHSEGFDPERMGSFFLYCPLIYQHYEKMHREDRFLQYPVRYMAKHLAFTELKMPLRPKLKSWEQLHKERSYSELTAIDYGYDARPILDYKSQEILLKTLFGDASPETKKKYLSNKKDTGYLTTIYEFETDVYKWD